MSSLHHPSPPASPGSDFHHQQAAALADAYDANAARSPGYPSPPTSPPHMDDSASTSRKSSASAMPAPGSRHASSSSRNGYAPYGYTSMAGAGAAMQHSSNSMPPPSAPSAAFTQHPPSKLATGGQIHSHRPVSAMPTPTEHGTPNRANAAVAGGASNVFASMNANYTERRASAHPTMSSSHTGSSSGSIPSSIDPATSQAISSGIPVTSPAALSYFAAHPRRQQVHFGNYLLLQTLGEGEFGKVKLGVHKEWGEEVAVKLIKRDKVASDAPLNLDDNADRDPAKMSKVEREIRVLKDVRHPNIVRLYEVIESDRYIGIVLEYASGGELFDHILAHKYLKEEHACRLFAQLISGVSYLHQKKIVHRDLKLENLLLDRNRNVIITDFGFANNFEDKRDDLMATSCGSPCYAAPELVVQDGLYAGSAVDVWSCGVILYAMLAGYLPFDDDPANPDGDNINLLYKYILATPLSFPEYITAQPRDLLSKMLVPDPTRRATLEQVMQHSWLRNYRELFKFSVDDLERAAMEQQTKKRQMYRQQMVYQQQLQEQQRRQHMERSQSARQNVSHVPVGTAYTTNTAVPASSAPSHRQTLPVSATVPDRLYEPVGSASRGVDPSHAAAARVAAPVAPVSAHVTPAAVQNSVAEPIVAPLTRAATHANVPAAGTASLVDPVTALGNARGEPRTRLDEDTTRSSSSAAAAREAEQRRAAAQKVQRHTIQLEYSTEERARKESSSTVAPPGSRQASQSHRKVSASSTTSRGSESERAKAAADKLAAAAVPPSVLQPVPAKNIPAMHVVVPESEKVIDNKAESRVAPDSVRSVSAGSASRVSVPRVIDENTQVTSASSRTQAAPSSRIRVPSSASASGRAIAHSGAAGRTTSVHRNVSNPVPAGEPVGFPSSDSTVTRSNSTRNGASAAAVSSTSSRPPSATRPPSSGSRHRKGMSTDRFSLSRLLGSNNVTSSNGVVTRSATDKASSEVPTETSKRNSASRAPLDRAPSSDSAGKTSRRKAMSLVVGRPGKSSPAAADRARALESSADASMVRQNSVRSSQRVAEQKQRKETANVTGSGSSVSSSRLATSGTARQQPLQQALQQQQSQDKTFYDGSTINSTSTAGPSSNAAKKVMDWFRKKSLSRGVFNEQPPLGPFERTPASSSVAPSVVVTGEQNDTSGNGASRHKEAQTGSAEGASSVPSSRSTSGTHSENSEATDLTQITVTDASHGDSEGVKSSASTVQQQATPKASLSAVSNVSNISNGSEVESSSSVAAGASTSTTVQQKRRSARIFTAKSASAAAATAPFNETRLRYHEGAVDQSALTSRSPVDVLKEVQRVLYEMGIDVRKEKDEDFKLECVRRKRTRTLMSATQGFGMSIRSSVFPPTQADVERSARFSLTPSASTPGGGSLRNLLKRGSYQPGAATSPKLGTTALPASATVTGGLVVQDENQPPPLYGDAAVDGGQEIRFSVEVTRIKNLPGLYSLDIRRMKGNLWAYKFVYQALLDRCHLAA